MMVLVNCLLLKLYRKPTKMFLVPEGIRTRYLLFSQDTGSSKSLIPSVIRVLVAQWLERLTGDQISV